MNQKIMYVSRLTPGKLLLSAIGLLLSSNIFAAPSPKLPVLPEYQAVLRFCPDNGGLKWIPSPLLEVGDTGPGGGIIFYNDGCLGLEAAPVDWDGNGDDDDPSVQWGCNGTEITGADGTAVGTGAQNTQDILAGCDDGGIAAELAADYTWPNGQQDGFLPSKDELNLMYTELHLKVVGGFANDLYWSSTEDNRFSAWYQNYFGNGSQGASNKNSTFIRVRAVRAF